MSFRSYVGTLASVCSVPHTQACLQHEVPFAGEDVGPGAYRMSCAHRLFFVAIARPEGKFSNGVKMMGGRNLKHSVYLGKRAYVWSCLTKNTNANYCLTFSRKPN